MTHKTFTEQFLEARMVSTPLVVVRTHDPFATTKAIAAAFGEKKDSLPFLSWDAIRGLQGLTDVGANAVIDMLKPSGTSEAETVDLSVALGVLSQATENVIAFVHNPHLVWDTDKKVIQGIMNLRDDYKANGNMAVFIVGVGDDLPSEIGQDVLVLEVPLPTRDQLSAIVKNMYAYAGEEKKFSACKKGPSQEVIERAVDAGIGIPPFPFEQATSICLDKVTGILDIDAMWSRKREIVTQNPGLTYHHGGETLKDMYGCETIKDFGTALMGGKKSPTIVLRMDEIEKQFAGNGTDSSGTKGNLLGEFLTWVNDRKVIASLFLGVPGSSKSWSAYCIGGEFGKPVINYNVSAMEHEHVGKSTKHMRTANRILDAISGGRIWLIATANSLNGLPPELVSRFQVGGIFFFDAPDAAEREGIMNLKIQSYGLDASQHLPDMTNWTGRDCDNCARKADLLGCSLIEAGRYVVPLLTSHGEQMDSLRMSASGRFLSAAKPGVYQYSATPVKHDPTSRIIDGRKFRTE